MIDERASDGEQRLLSAVGEARARLRRIAGRALLRERAWWVLGAGAATAACRPWVWRFAADAPLWTGIGRALAMFAFGSAVAAAALIVAGRRRGPSEIGAARAVDEALGTPELLASGVAFVRAGRDEPVVRIARRRADERAASVRVRELFALPSLRPSLRSTAVFALCAAIAIGAGGYERGLATALLAPPTSAESAAAKALEAAAAAIASVQAKDTKAPAPESPSPRRATRGDKLGGAGHALADKATEAARAARRGDRRGALAQLGELRSAGRESAGRAGGLKETLRKLAEALAPSSDKRGSGANAATPSQDAAESMRLLANKIRSPDSAAGAGSESSERVLERLERAAEEARKAGAQGGSREANEAARALSRAAESLRRGDRAAASEALSEAAERAAAMEQARAAAAAEAMAILEMLDRSGELEHAIQLAMLGGEGQGGERGEQGDGQGRSGEGQSGEGQGKGGQGNGPGGRAAGLRRALLARLAAMGAAESPEGSNESPGSGPHMADRRRGKRASIKVEGSVRAPSQVGDGPRAIQAISGLGRGTEPPPAYREVFPSYDAAMEEGLADERIPAERRRAVRRYFESIRPEQGK